MSRTIPQPDDALPGGARLRSEWRRCDADLIVDLHRRGYAGEGPSFADPFPDYVGETVREAGLGVPEAPQHSAGCVRGRRHGRGDDLHRSGDVVFDGGPDRATAQGVGAAAG